jgi:hypothetical protein
MFLRQLSEKRLKLRGGGIFAPLEIFFFQCLTGEKKSPQTFPKELSLCGSQEGVSRPLAYKALSHIPIPFSVG